VEDPEDILLPHLPNMMVAVSRIVRKRVPIERKRVPIERPLRLLRP
jgi:hypothetical protein